MTETQTTETPECQRSHGDTSFGFAMGILIMVGLAAIGFLTRPSSVMQPRCAEFRQHGYHTVPSNNRASVWLEEFRQKTSYTPTVRLYASPFMQAYGWSDPCDGREIIVLGLAYINTWTADELHGLLGHEFGHKLAHRHKNPTDGNSDQGQHEADGYAIELVGESVYFTYLRREGWDEYGARKRIKEGKEALAELRKRAPLV